METATNAVLKENLWVIGWGMTSLTKLLQSSYYIQKISWTNIEMVESEYVLLMSQTKETKQGKKSLIGGRIKKATKQRGVTQSQKQMKQNDPSKEQSLRKCKTHPIQ